jgi:hypothetical protein
MGLTAYYDEALEHIAQTDFTQSATEVNVFETTIRCQSRLAFRC